jgi:hypothetical protein
MRLAPTITATNTPERHSPPEACLGVVAAAPSGERGSRHVATAVAAIVAASTQTRWPAPSRLSTTPPAMLAKMNATDPHSRTGP